MSYFINTEYFGNVEVVENARRTHIGAKINPDGTVIVAAPLNTDQKHILRFLDTSVEQIMAVREQVLAKNGGRGAITFTPETEFHTRSHSLVFKQVAPGRPCGSQVTADAINVYYDDPEVFKQAQYQAFIHKSIDLALKMEAEAYLPQRTAELAKANGLSFHHVDLRNTKRQWGSCNTSGRICLNIQVMRLPDHLIDLVILHELTHTLHMDHSPAFYADLNRFLGGKHDQLHAELKTHGIWY